MPGSVIVVNNVSPVTPSSVPCTSLVPLCDVTELYTLHENTASKGFRLRTFQRRYLLGSGEHIGMSLSLEGT